MENLYLLKKEKDCKKVLRTVAHIGFRCGIVVAAVLLLGVWAGMEFGPIMLGRRLLMSAMLLVMLGVSALGMSLTGDVTLPLDGGEEDE